MDQGCIPHLKYQNQRVEMMHGTEEQQEERIDGKREDRNTSKRNG